MPLSYQQPGLVMRVGSAGTKQQAADLQEHLRALGYLRRGIDGAFGAGTENAVKALQHDLLNNAGKSRGSDGAAPVRVIDYNKGRVTRVDGIVDQPLAAVIAEILADPAWPKLPKAADPRAENAKVAAQLRTMHSTVAPIPYVMAVLRQESGLMHYAVPSGADRDSYIIVGLDTNQGARHVVTSRGYGAGQYTLFHHPPRAEEVQGVMLDPGRNVERAAKLLREKLNAFVNGPSSTADDRIAETGKGPVRLCKYPQSDPRYLSDCRNCAVAAGFRSTRPGLPVFPGSSTLWQTTQYYPTATYQDVPVREKIGCDWPYAVRRYNGGGINSYHYQARVLKFLVA